DLGTTNSAVAYIDTQEAARNNAVIIYTFQVPQLVAEGEVGAASTLPSFIYFAGEHDMAASGLRLPWQQQTAPVVGWLARERGARVDGAGSARRRAKEPDAA